MEISAIKLVRKGEHAVVEIETATGWTEVISEFVDAPFSHIVEESGMQRCVTNTDKWRGTQVEAAAVHITLGLTCGDERQ